MVFFVCDTSSVDQIFGHEFHELPRKLLYPNRTFFAADYADGKSPQSCVIHDLFSGQEETACQLMR